MSRPERPEPATTRDEPAVRPTATDEHDDSLIDAHLRLSPAERLRALQSFVEDVIRMRDGRRPAVR
jgi:hypothetical protein